MISGTARELQAQASEHRRDRIDTSMRETREGREEREERLRVTPHKESRARADRQLLTARVQTQHAQLVAVQLDELVRPTPGVAAP